MKIIDVIAPGQKKFVPMCIVYLNSLGKEYGLERRDYNDYDYQPLPNPYGDWLNLPSESLLMIPKPVGDWDC